MAQRKRKHSRRQAEARRRWHDLHAAQRAKYTGLWKRRDRRRAAFQTMKHRLRIVQADRTCRATGVIEDEAAHQTGEMFGCSVSSVRNDHRTWKTQGKQGLLPVITVRTYRPKTPWEVIQIILLFRRVLHWGAIGLPRN